MRNVEWRRNLQIPSLQMTTGFCPVLCIFAVILLLICPLGVHSCVKVAVLLVTFAVLFSNAYAIITGEVVGLSWQLAFLVFQGSKA